MYTVCIEIIDIINNLVWVDFGDYIINFDAELDTTFCPPYTSQTT